MGTLIRDHDETKPPDAVVLRLVPRLPQSDTEPFTPAELAEARYLMRAMRKLMSGCPVAESILKDPSPP